MDFKSEGASLRHLFDAEIRTLLLCYEHFEKLVPGDGRSGSAHAGEDGRYVESLLRQHLQKYLPRDLEVLTGFILRPAIITGKDGAEREGKGDRKSRQLDIIVYDTAHYPLFQRFENNVVAPPEGVVAVLSVKKHLRSGNVKAECESLGDVADLCRCKDHAGQVIRGPFLGIVAMDSAFEKVVDKKRVAKSSEVVIAEVLEELRLACQNPIPYFDRVVGYIGALKKWGITKRRPSLGDNQRNAAMSHIIHETDNAAADWGLQFILSGILSVYYDKSRGQNRRRPGFTAFESSPNQVSQTLIPINGLYLPNDSWDQLP